MDLFTTPTMDNTSTGLRSALHVAAKAGNMLNAECAIGVSGSEVRSLRKFLD